MDVRIAPILPSQSSLFFNLFQLYLHDLSAFTGEEPGKTGDLIWRTLTFTWSGKNCILISSIVRGK